jgi:hypothetical protein
MARTWPVAGSIATSAAWSGSASGGQRLPPFVDLFERIDDGRLGVGLQLHVDGREDAKTPLIDPLPSESIDQFPPHLFLEVLALDAVVAESVAEGDLFGARALPFGLRDRAILEHRLEHEVAARHRALHVDGRRVGRRRFDEAGQHRRLGDGQFRRVLVEEAARRRFHSVQAGAEVDLVEIELENPRLRILPFEPCRQNDLLQLAAERLIGGQEAQTRELLGDRRGALRRAPAPDIPQRRGNDALGVEAVMVIEALIFD